VDHFHYSNNDDHGAVAIDGLGRLYFGGDRFFRRDPASTDPPVAAWEAYGITGFAPAPNGVVYVSNYSSNTIVKLFCPG
jgi:hypothetical protein